jgi:hypothetical protein
MPRYKRHIDVLLTQQEYETLLMLHGYAAGSLAEGDRTRWRFIHLTNRIFGGQPSFQRYEIPEEFRWKDEPPS